MSLQKALYFVGQLGTDPFSRGDFLRAGFAQPFDRSKFSQKQAFPVLTHTRAIVENAFFDSLFQKEPVIGIGESMSLIADALQ